MTDPEDLVRRMLDAHNECPDALLERVTYRGREGIERHYREGAEVFGAGEVHIRSHSGALEAPGA